MGFRHPNQLPYRLVKDFWEHVESSYTLEKMYEETENVLVTLEDVEKNQKERFIYFKSKRGIGIRILNSDGYYLAHLWKKKVKKRLDIGGFFEGNNGESGFQQCLNLLLSSVNTGIVSMTIEKSPFPPSLNIPMTEREQEFLALFHKGFNLDEICAHMSLKKLSKAWEIQTSLFRKGKINYELWKSSQNQIENNY